MDPRIVNYIREYHEKYGMENLKKALRRRGYDEKDILEAEHEFYRDPKGLSPIPEKKKEDIGSRENHYSKSAFMLGIFSFFIGWVPIIGWIIIAYAYITASKGIRLCQKDILYGGKDKAIFGMIFASLGLIISILVITHASILIINTGTITPEVPIKDEPFMGGVQLYQGDSQRYEELKTDVRKTCRFPGEIDCENYGKGEGVISFSLKNRFERDIIMTDIEVSSTVGGSCMWSGEEALISRESIMVEVTCEQLVTQKGRFDVHLNFWFADSFPDFSKTAKGEMII